MNNHFYYRLKNNIFTESLISSIYFIEEFPIPQRKTAAKPEVLSPVEMVENFERDEAKTAQLKANLAGEGVGHGERMCLARMARQDRRARRAARAEALSSD